MKKYRKILLVDDDPVVNFLHEAIISELSIGEEIKFLANGQQALDYIKTNCLNSTDKRPDLILLDINMPFMDGFELLHALKVLEKLTIINSRIAVITSSEDKRDIALLKVLGIKEVLTKPLTSEKAINLLERLEDQTSSFNENPKESMYNL